MKFHETREKGHGREEVRRCRTLVAEPPLHRPEDVGIIERGMQNGLRLRIADQATKDGAPRARIIEPVELRRAAGGWYLTAWDPDAGGWRAFKLARPANAMLPEDRALGRAPQDGVREYAFRVGIGSGDEQDLAGLVDAAHARAVRGFLRKGVQRLEERADGSPLLRSRLAGTEELLRWLLRWGRHAGALEPASFRRQVAGDLATMGGMLRRGRSTDPVSGPPAMCYCARRGARLSSEAMTSFMSIAEGIHHTMLQELPWSIPSFPSLSPSLSPVPSPGPTASSRDRTRTPACRPGLGLDGGGG